MQVVDVQQLRSWFIMDWLIWTYIIWYRYSFCEAEESFCGLPFVKKLDFWNRSHTWATQCENLMVCICFCIWFKLCLRGNVHYLVCFLISSSVPFCLFVDPQQLWVGGPQRGPLVSERLQCNICGKVFQNRNSLCEHKNVHSGKTQCPVCSAVLSRIRHVRRHMISKHGWLL